MAYLPCIPPVPVQSEMRAYEWLDMFATWGMLAVVSGILYLEYQTYKRTK